MDKESYEPSKLADVKLEQQVEDDRVSHSGLGKPARQLQLAPQLPPLPDASQFWDAALRITKSTTKGSASSGL